MAARSLFTSESVSMGHPDKMCDQISDADPRRDARPGSALARRLRDADDDRPRRWWRARSRRRAQVEIPTIVRRWSTTSATRAPTMGFDAATCAVHGRPRQAVARHRPGRDRGRGPAQGAGRRRPGHDVRLRLRRDAELMPAPIRLCAPPDRAPPRALRERRARLPAPRRQVPGHGRVRRRRTARSASTRSCSRPSTPPTSAYDQADART